MKKREYKDYLLDIFEAIEKIEKFTIDLNFSEFKNDEKTVFAVIRLLEIIGEAAKKIPRDIRKNYDQIPWKNMAGMRDKLIHEYFGVNIKVLWKTIKEKIPEIKPEIKKIIHQEKLFN